MIKVCSKDIFHIDVQDFEKQQLINFCQKHGRVNDIKFVIYDGEKIIKVITHNDLINDAEVSEVNFIHNKNIFIEVRNYFYGNNLQEGSCVAVLNKNGKLSYLLQYFENEFYKKGHLNFSNDKFAHYTNNDDTVDFTLLNRADAYVFMRMEEYTYKIASLILEHMPEKEIYFMDENAKMFFDSNKIKYINGFYDLLQMQQNYKSYMYVTSTISKINTSLPQYTVKHYNSIEIMTSLYWLKDIKIRSNGNRNRDKTFLVLDYPTNTAGLVDIMKSILIQCIFAEDRGYIPVIDLNSFPNQYLSETGENMWEYYFEQVSGYSLDEVYNSSNVIFASESNIKFGHRYNPYFTEIENNIYAQAKSKRNWLSDKIKWKEDVIQYCKENMPKEFSENKRILGVISRGTDYNKEAVMFRLGEKTKNASVDRLIKEVKAQFDIWKCDYIYLATEDSENYSQFKAEFGDRLLCADQKRVTYGTNMELAKIPVAEILNTTNRYEFGKKYLSILWCLSKCNMLISSVYCGSALAAESLNKGEYEFDMTL